MLITLLLVFHLFGLISAINAVMTVRTSQGAIAWAVVLLTFPYVAVVAYWVFGRSKFAGYRSERLVSDAIIQKKHHYLLANFADFRVPAGELTAREQAAEKLVKLPYLANNAVELLIDGEATFASIITGISQAKHYILFQFFIVHDDGLGQRIKAALLDKAKQGIKIHFLYDEIGSYQLSQHYKNELRVAGIELFNFHSQKGIKNRFQVNFRNHRKVVVVDGKVAWLGGHNVGDEYLGLSKKFGAWRDTHIKITGPAVLTVQIAFIEDWYWAAEQQLSHLLWQAEAAATANIKVLILPSSPAESLETASLMFLQTINSAKKRLWLTSPYFVPDEAIIKALQLAGLRGVDVRIILPDMADHWAVYLASFTYIKAASCTGVKFFRYQQGFMHSKVMLVDDSHAGVGSANLDNRSLRLNFEITALIADSCFNAQVARMFADDFNHCREIMANELSDKPVLFRIAARIARLMAPIL
ncbi:cardiolipin synthase [Colwellia sp. TT2012]|uniref:cardiolipin synthase n=1 Tax=Colwellia sp. TT2012 TaxID=1720342 RepID=UPI00070C54A3|nr:cardiolipin synthase [Colwellia sp. TT2012]